MLSYHENNIIFRIASADALSKFKAIQAHSFLQMCRKEFDIDHSAREILLLSYDRFSNLVLLLEKSFLVSDTSVFTAALRQHTVSCITDHFSVIEEICQTNPDVFSSESCDLIKVIHSYARAIFSNQLNALNDLPLAAAFSSIIDLLSEYLQQLLVVIHEYDNNIIKNAADKFISVTKFCALKSNDECTPVSIRANWYKQCNPKIESFIVKNYTHADELTRCVKKHLSEIGFVPVDEKHEVEV